MKVMLSAILFCLLTTVMSCNKCYDCKTSASTQSYCKGSTEYDVLKAGGTLTDNNGDAYSCNLK
ncbi:MAG: hypothetical protein U0T74_11410 [Chitinophagales bacterium]